MALNVILTIVYSTKIDREFRFKSTYHYKNFTESSKNFDLIIFLLTFIVI